MRTRRRATRDRIAHSKFMRWAKLCGLHASWKRQGFRPVSTSHPRRHNPLVTTRAVDIADLRHAQVRV